MPSWRRMAGSESPTAAAGHRLPYCWRSDCGVVLISSTRDTEPVGERFAVGRGFLRTVIAMLWHERAAVGDVRPPGLR